MFFCTVDNIHYSNPARPNVHFANQTRKNIVKTRWKSNLFDNGQTVDIHGKYVKINTRERVWNTQFAKISTVFFLNEWKNIDSASLTEAYIGQHWTICLNYIRYTEEGYISPVNSFYVARKSQKLQINSS